MNQSYQRFVQKLVDERKQFTAQTQKMEREHRLRLELFTRDHDARMARLESEIKTMFPDIRD